MTKRVSPARRRDWPTGLSDQPGPELVNEIALGSTSLRRPPLRRSVGRAAILCCLVCLPVVAGCTYVERARGVSDLAVATSQFYKLEALVQLDVERRRIRSARCYSPLLTPATISSAALDSRLGSGWVDELLRDCPQFAAFLSELTRRRGVSGAMPPPADIAEEPASSIWLFPSPAADDEAAEELRG